MEQLYIVAGVAEIPNFVLVRFGRSDGNLYLSRHLEYPHVGIEYEQEPWWYQPGV